MLLSSLCTRTASQAALDSLQAARREDEQEEDEGEESRWETARGTPSRRATLASSRYKAQSRRRTCEHLAFEIWLCAHDDLSTLISFSRLFHNF